MRCNYYLRDPLAESRTAIYMSVSYRGQRCILFPGESINRHDWINDKKRRINKPKQIAENNALIGRLNRFEQLVRDTYDDLQRTTRGIVSADVFKKAITEKVRPSSMPKEKQILIVDFFQMLIEDTLSAKRLHKNGKAITKGTIIEYETTQRRFADFQDECKRTYTLKDISQKLVDNFSDYLNVKLNLAFNGSGKYMKTFRTMMNYARQKKLIDLETVMDTKITVTKESPDNIYLSEKEIEDMMNLKNLPSSLHKTVRDYFVIGCKTGLRFSDFSNLNTARDDKEFFTVTQKKVQSKVVIPKHPLVTQILAKYPDGKLPQCPCNQIFNKYLKDIGKLLPSLDVDFEKTVTRSRKPVATIYKKWQLLQTHTARRSFCTNEYLSGTPVPTIRAISGHKTDQSFNLYIKADSLQHAMVLRDRWDSKRIN